MNKVPIESALPLMAGGTITPARKTFQAEGVDVLLLAGVAPPNDSRAHGWYVFCNGRMVVDADRSTLTGWGDGLPAFHMGKYRRFVGFVYFRSDDVRKLPWRTTKQGVDADNEVYRAALLEMTVQARAVTSFLDNMYPRDADVDATLDREVLARSSSVSIGTMARSEQPFSIAIPKRPRKQTVSIQYERPKDTVARIANYLGKRGLAAGRVGEFTFDFFVEQELD